MARANTSAAAVHSRSSAAARATGPNGPSVTPSGLALVATAKTVSPSNIVCAGRMALARPSWAATASRRHSVLVRSASTATTPMVVFRSVLSAGGSAAGVFGHTTPNSPATSWSAAYGTPVAMSTADPAAFTTASAPTVKPSTWVDAVPTPPLSCPTLAPVPAPTVPAAKLAAAFSQAAYPKDASGRLPQSLAGRSKITAAGTIGTTSCSSVPAGKPRFRSDSQRITPSAAASP
jgi:hypothetical protein